MKKSTELKIRRKPDFGKEKISILHEDSAIAVIFKPEGMLSVPYPGSRSRTAVDALEDLLRKNGTYSKNHRPFVVHRLDRDTSGVMMFAMTEQAQKRIMDNWQQIVTSRLYHAVAENPSDSSMILPDFGTIDDSLAYNSHNIGFVPKIDDSPKNSANTRKRISTSGNGAEKSVYERNLSVENGKLKFKTISARTNYKILLRGKGFTLFELSLDTGRKNQIRAHLSSKGYPLAGDENYRAKTDPFGRLLLHARTLEFFHPVSGKQMKFEIPESEDWLSLAKDGRKDSFPAPWLIREASNIKKERDFHKNARHFERKTKNLDFIAKGMLRKK